MSKGLLKDKLACVYIGADGGRRENILSVAQFQIMLSNCIRFLEVVDLNNGNVLAN